MGCIKLDFDVNSPVEQVWNLACRPREYPSGSLMWSR